jgi:hypothetical protein
MIINIALDKNVIILENVLVRKINIVTGMLLQQAISVQPMQIVMIVKHKENGVNKNFSVEILIMCVLMPLKTPQQVPHLEIVHLPVEPMRFV